MPFAVPLNAGVRRACVKDLPMLTNSNPVYRKWLATIITIPVSAVFLFLGLISTGAGHGSAAILKMFYAPLFLLKISVELPGGIVTGCIIFCLLHIGYAAIADWLRGKSGGVIYFGLLLTIHYLIYFYGVLDDEDKSKFVKSYELDKSLISCFIGLFVLWQGLLLKRSNSIAKRKMHKLV